jgi:hypothetical protein
MSGTAGPIKNSYQILSGRSYQSCDTTTKAGRFLVNSITNSKLYILDTILYSRRQAPFHNLFHKKTPDHLMTRQITTILGELESKPKLSSASDGIRTRIRPCSPS